MNADENIHEMMGGLEKLRTLLTSRRFWLYGARLVVTLMVLATFIFPILGQAAPDVPDEEELADRLMKAVERIAAILGTVIALVTLIVDGKQVSADYTIRPPGACDRSGLPSPG